MYLLEYPGNIYLNHHKGKAEFVEHRLGSQYRGYMVELGTNRTVATDPSDVYPDPVPPCVLCGKPSATYLEEVCLDCSGEGADHHNLL